MYPATSQYKNEMKQIFRNRSYVQVVLGMINQEAQNSISVAEPDKYTYYSNLTAPMGNQEVTELYAACDENWTSADGSMYFLPRLKEDVLLNAGIVSESMLGSIEFRFPVALSMKGLTVDFGKGFPVDFTIQSDRNQVVITGNHSAEFITEAVFEDATYLRFTPSKLVNGKGRLRIHQLTLGIGISFDNRKIQSATRKEHISPIMEDLQSIDFHLTIENRDRVFDVENAASSVNFLELGQEIRVYYGLELEKNQIEWMPGGVFQLKEWSADDECMSFTATDRFDSMDGIYYLGEYHTEGISLSQLAVTVFEDAGILEQEYWIDPYLKGVLVQNPIPPVTHKEALQMIANAGRCLLYQDRSGKIILKSSFIPDMEAGSDNQTYFSQSDRVLDGGEKEVYGTAALNYTDTESGSYFLPRKGGTEYRNTGYISEAVADSRGLFHGNPTVKIHLESSYKCFGLKLEFGRNPPKEMQIHSYRDGTLYESYQATDLAGITVLNHEFPEFDLMVLEFIRGTPNNRVTLNNLAFGESTDYLLEYGSELVKTPRGIQLTRVKELQAVRTVYSFNDEGMGLAKEMVYAADQESFHTFYFMNACYDLNCEITNPLPGQRAEIIEQSAYFATVRLTGVRGFVEVSITGREYTLSKSKVTKQLHSTGSIQSWENPLVSSPDHASDMADWIGNYLAADREYELQYRGEPRIDANDLLFLENKYVDDLLIRVYEHTLKFNGALSGSIKARRDVSVGNTKNRLEGQ